MGSEKVDLCLRKEAEGFHLTMRGDFAPENRRQAERMAELLQPAVRNPALVEAYRLRDRAAFDKAVAACAAADEEKETEEA